MSKYLYVLQKVATVLQWKGLYETQRNIKQDQKINYVSILKVFKKHRNRMIGFFNSISYIL